MLILALAFLALPQPAYRVGSAPADPAPPSASAGASYRTGSPPPAYRTESASSEEPAYNIAPSVAPAPPPQLAHTGVLIDAYDKRVESRWGTDDPFYTGTIRGGAAIAQSRQGPLDGSWIVLSADGAPIYSLQLADAPDGSGVEGAWRENRPGSVGVVTPAKSGFIALIGREPGRTVFRFVEPGASAPTVLTVRPMGDGSWRGELARASGETTPVTMRRRE